MTTSRDFHTVDYGLFALSLVLSLGIGVWAALSGGKQKTTSEFLMGNRNLNPLAVGMSIFMSFISAILVLGNTAEMYLYGVQWWMQVWGAILSYFYICIMFVPFFYRLNLTSSFEYFEMRFQGKLVRYTGDILQILYQVLYMGTSLYAPAIALNGAIGFPEWATILICGFIATLYTAIGGMKAVVWTDLVQGFIYIGGVIVILAIGTNKVGGIDKVWDAAKDYERLGFFNFDMSPLNRLTFWPLVVGTFVSTLNTVGTGQTSVQRYCAVSSIDKARFTVLMLAPALLLMFTITCLLGLVIFAYYNTIEKCDPMRIGEVTNPNTLLPIFLIDVIDIPGLGGLFLSVLFSGALSTLSSSISALAAITWKDVLEHRYNHWSEEKKTITTKLLSVVYGTLGVAAAFLISNMEGPIAQASTGLVAGVAGPLLGMFLLGMFIPWANAKSTMAAAWIGLGFVLWAAIGFYTDNPYLNYPETETSNCTGPVSVIPEDKDVFPLYKLSFLWYAAMGTTITMALGIVLSFITGPTDPRSLDPNLTIPMFDKLFCCLPQSWREKLWCGVPYEERGEEDWWGNRPDEPVISTKGVGQENGGFNASDEDNTLKRRNIEGNANDTHQTSTGYVHYTVDNPEEEGVKL